jgi:sec-independent protein translocase protein TatA
MTMDIFAPSHLLVLLVIILIIFGPSKLGDVGGALGKAIKDFKKAMNDPEAPNPQAQKTAESKPPVEANPIKPS